MTTNVNTSKILNLKNLLQVFPPLFLMVSLATASVFPDFPLHLKYSGKSRGFHYSFI